MNRTPIKRNSNGVMHQTAEFYSGGYYIANSTYHTVTRKGEDVGKLNKNIVRRTLWGSSDVFHKFILSRNNKK